MKNLNQTWLMLIIAGVIFLVFYFLWSFFEGLSGANSKFSHKSAPFISTTLISPLLEDHFTIVNSQEIPE